MSTPEFTLRSGARRRAGEAVLCRAGPPRTLHSVLSATRRRRNWRAKARPCGLSPYLRRAADVAFIDLRPLLWGPRGRGEREGGLLPARSPEGAAFTNPRALPQADRAACRRCFEIQ